MTIKSILVPADGGDTLKDVLDAALEVARRFDAHITVLHVSESAAKAVAENLPKALKQTVEEEELKTLSSKAQKVADEVAAFAKKRKLVVSDRQENDGNVSIEFRHLIGKVKETMVHYGRLCDTTAVIRPRKHMV